MMPPSLPYIERHFAPLSVALFFAIADIGLLFKAKALRDAALQKSGQINGDMGMSDYFLNRPHYVLIQRVGGFLSLLLSIFIFWATFSGALHLVK